MTWAYLTFVSQREASRKDRRGGDPEIRCTTLPMGNLRTVMSAALLSFAACSGDGAAKPDAPLIHLDAAIDAIPDAPPPIDAPNYDFTCLNNTAPTNIAATVTISGTAQEIYLNGTSPGIRANGDVAVKACKGDCMNANNLGTTASTVGTGAYSTASLTTGGTAVDGYLDATKVGDRRTLVYPPSPVAQSQNNVPILQFSTAAFNALNAIGLISQNDQNNGMIGIVVTDCMNTPIDGAAVTAKQGGNAAGDAPLDLGPLSQGMAPGTWLITNVPPGDTTVSASYLGMTLRAHVVKSVLAATTTTGIRPGF